MPPKKVNPTDDAPPKPWTRRPTHQRRIHGVSGPLPMAFMALGHQSGGVIIKPYIFSKMAFLSQIDSYLRSPVRFSLKILKYYGLK